MACDHIEIPEKGRKCEICHVAHDVNNDICHSCSSILATLQEIQGTRGYGNSLVHVLTSLQKWAKDLPAWGLLRGMDLLTRPVNQQFNRTDQQLSGTKIASQNRSDHGGRKRARNHSAAEIAGFFASPAANKSLAASDFGVNLKIAGSSQRPWPQVAAAARFCGRSDHGTLRSTTSCHFHCS